MADIPPAGSFEYLKTQAVSRLYLDNFANIQSSWVTQGLKIGQLALLYGANDMGSLMIEENVVAEAGTVHFLTLDEIRDAISELGYTPRQRNVFYELLDPKQEQFAVEANRARSDQIRIGGARPAAMVFHRSDLHQGERSIEISNADHASQSPPIVPLTVVSGDGTA